MVVPFLAVPGLAEWAPKYAYKNLDNSYQEVYVMSISRVIQSRAGYATFNELNCSIQYKNL